MAEYLYNLDIIRGYYILPSAKQRFNLLEQLCDGHFSRIRRNISTHRLLTKEEFKQYVLRHITLLQAYYNRYTQLVDNPPKLYELELYVTDESEKHIYAIISLDRDIKLFPPNQPARAHLLR